MDESPTGRNAHGSTPAAAGSAASARRQRMRAQALARRALAPHHDQFVTPEWLDRSFVLPLTEPQVTTLPTQPQPLHDDLALPTVTRTRPDFVRPVTADIDFALVVRRNDLARSCSRAARTGVGLAGLSTVGFLLTSAPWLIPLAGVLVLVAVVAGATRVWLRHSPLPQLPR